MIWPISIAFCVVVVCLTFLIREAMRHAADQSRYNACAQADWKIEDFLKTQSDVEWFKGEVGEAGEGK